MSRRAGVRGLSVLQASENEQYERKTIMKKIMCAIVLGGIACAMTGCRSTDVDEWRSDLKTTLCPAKFKPVYEVIHLGVMMRIFI